MSLINNSFTRICVLLVSVMLLHTACGGGGGVVSPERAEKGVFTGFVGDFNWELYDEGGPADGDGEGIGEGADGDGGFGIGGALGQFRGALVRVFFPSGELLGEALTDNTTGMVTVKPGKTYAGSLLIEIHGQEGATYFEEGKNQYVPYGPGNILRSIVPDVRRNIGITPFTEAGYQLALRCQQGQGPSEVCGSAQGTSNETLPSMAATRAANERVQTVLNQQLPFSMQVDDITRWPVAIGDANGPGSADTDARGRYGLANIAFSKQAAMYNTDQEAPTLRATEQLSRDLLDGKLDGETDGAPAVSAALRTYDPHSFTSELTSALAQQANLYGTGGAISSLPLISAFGNVRYDGYYFDARIGVGGEAETVAVATETASTSRNPGEITEYVRPQGANRGFMVYGNMGNGGLIVKTDSINSTSQVLAIGDNVNGELGVGRSGEVENPAPVSTAGVLTHATGGFGHLLTRFADGSVYTVGDNSESQLGVGLNGGALANALTPQRVALPEGALAVAAANAASFALLENGQVYSWGSGWGFGTLGDGSADGLRTSPEPVMSTDGPLTDVVQLSARDNDAIVLKADNSVWTWGSFSQNLPTSGAPLGVRAGNAVATRVNGLPGGEVRKVLTEQGLFIAVMADGAVYSWGIHFDITAQDYLYDMQPTRVLNLPPVRDVMPGGFNGYGQRPFDRLTAMGADYSGRYWKIRGRVAERYDPLNPTAQRRPVGQAPRADCASCHTVRDNTDPVLPGTGPACVLPSFKLDNSGAPVLVNSASDCGSCHNGGTLSNGRVLTALTCVTPNLPAPGPLTQTTPLTEPCALPNNHPVPTEQLGNSCATCHNSVVAAPLSCSVDNGVVEPPSTTTVSINTAIDNVRVTGNLQSGARTDDTTPTFTGTISAGLVAGERIEIRANGRDIGAPNVDGVNWNLTPTPLAEGTYSVVGRIVNAGGAGGQASEPFSLTISTSTVTQTVTILQAFDDVGSKQGKVEDGAPTNDPQPEVEGVFSQNLTPGMSVRIDRSGPDGEQSFSQSVDGSDFSVRDPNPMQTNGRYVYTARVVDDLGQLGAVSLPWAVVFDDVPPAPAQLVSVNADFPASLRTFVSGSISPDRGTIDNTPELIATIPNAVAGDGVEFFEADTLLSNGPVPVDANGGASHTHLTNFDLGRDGRSTFVLFYNVRSVDEAGNRSAASPPHRVNFGHFDCQAIRSRFASHPAGETCQNCHEDVSGRLLVPPTVGQGQTQPEQYWCSNATALIELIVPLPR
jgi:hypothetical protein